jgi:hypothetical protein
MPAELTPAEALACLEGRLQVTVDDGLFEVADALAVLAAAVEDAERQPATDCPACGWQGDQEAMDCEAAYEKATGRKLEPGDKEFLAFRAGWIAGHTRGKAPSPTPGEVDEAIRFFEEAVNCAEDSPYAECSDCGCVSPNATPMHHRDCETARHLATLRAALPAQGWRRESPTEPGFYWRSWCRHVSLEKVAKCTGDDGWYLGLVDEYGDEEPFEEGGWWMPASVPTPPHAEPGESPDAEGRG